MSDPVEDGLTPAAKAELHAAIAIIREDRFGRYARTVLNSHKPKDLPEPPKVDPPKVDPPTPPTPPTPPPPKVDPPKVDPAPEGLPVKKRRLWWGDQADD